LIGKKLDVHSIVFGRSEGLSATLIEETKERRRESMSNIYENHVKEGKM
jgi:hypothetical protein